MSFLCFFDHISSCDRLLNCKLSSTTMLSGVDLSRLVSPHGTAHCLRNMGSEERSLKKAESELPELQDF